MGGSKKVHYKKGERIKADTAKASLLNWYDSVKADVDFTYHSATRELEILRTFRLILTRRLMEDEPDQP